MGKYWKKLRKEFSKEGFSPLCDWSSCAYGDSLFYDTRYHLNKKGAFMNSQKLIKLLKQQLYYYDTIPLWPSYRVPQ